MTNWTESDVPDQTGRVTLITGANSGIGWDTARVLAANGARVVMACRSPERAGKALDRIKALHPDSDVSLLSIDLADIESIRRAVTEFQSAHDKLDLLINNAGLMFTPKRQTAQGFEMQFGVNHLGHFALTGLLLPAMSNVEGSRIVTVSSNGHRPGRIHFDDLHWENNYSAFGAYFQAKLANLLFTYELQRRLTAASMSTAALAAHPGGSKTNLGMESPGGFMGTLFSLARPLLEPVLTQSSAMGALPTLRAAVDPQARGGEYYGPGGFAEMGGFPVKVDSSDRSKDLEVATRLWSVSEAQTGVSFHW